jgi:protein ImuA
MKAQHAPHSPASRRPKPALGFGVPALDHCLKGGLARGALHEFYGARAADAMAVAGLGLVLAANAAERGKIIWVRQDHGRFETGAPSAAGLASLGLDHRRFVLVEARDMLSALRAALEGARCAGLSSLVLDVWGEHRVFDLTASRRLFLAAQTSGVTIFILRASAQPSASSAETRWQVKAAPSKAWVANAPGFPRFELTLLRNRSFSAGVANASWCVEWNSETRSFNLAGEDTIRSPLSRPVVPFPVNRQAADYRRAS